MRRYVLTLSLMLVLSACGSLIEARDKALNKGGQYYDEALNTAILWKCRASSIGAIERRYMRTTAQWEIWTQECLSDGAPEIPTRDETTVEELPSVDTQ